MADEREGTLADVLDAHELRRLAGWRTYERGAEYAAEARVDGRRAIPGGVAGTVLAIKPYAATLTARDGELRWTCDCPVGRAGELCKHVVALGLAQLAAPADETLPAGDHGQVAVGQPTSPAPPAPAAGPVAELTFEDAAAWVRSLDALGVAKLLLDAAAADPALRERLVTQARDALAAGGGAAELERAFEHAMQLPIGPRGRPDWGFVDRVEDVVERLERFLAPGTAAAIVPLVQRMIDAIDELVENLHDVEGDVGGLLDRLLALHRDACRLARPEPVALAAYLLEMELRESGSPFHGAAATYADVLGEAGLAEYRRLLEPHWTRLPVLGPGEQDTGRHDPARRREPSPWKVTSIAVQLADLSGDLDERIAVRARDLSHGDRFLAIARLCLEAGDTARAVDWAERGARAFRVPDSALVRFLAERFQELGRHDEALALAWSDFRIAPDPERYRALLAVAARAGEAAVWRERALELARSLVRDDVAPASVRGPVAERPGPAEPWTDWGLPEGATVLVELLLADDQDGAAWDAAVAHGCGRRTWLKLADARAEHHPRDAARAWRREVDEILAARDRGAYQQAAASAARVVQLEAAAGDPDAGATYLADLRARNKRRPAFLGELDRALVGGPTAGRQARRR